MQTSKQTLRHNGQAILTVLIAALLATAAFAQQRKYYRDDPLAVEPETQNADKVVPWKLDLFYDLMLNQFAHPGDHDSQRAKNINTIGEVPDSSWFTNRILARPLSVAEAVRGPITGDGPAKGKWTVIRAKSEGAAAGFTIKDSAGVTWFLAFDPKSNPEGATGCIAVAMRLFWSLGYYQAEYHISTLHPDSLDIDKDAKFHPPSGKIRPMKRSDVDPVLARGAKNADGTYRVIASRLLPGKILGGFQYYGTRPDDPNDVILHEHRRELRALQVFGAWINLVDLKAMNTMDTLITENGQARVRHYLLDVGSTLGMGANGPREWTEGYENLFEGDKAKKRLVTFGFYIQPWQTVKYHQMPSVGRFEGTQFNPEAWKSRVPATAILNADDEDTFWAARRVMAFSDEMIRAIVKTGQYSDPAAEKLLGDILIQRRNKIGQVYLTKVNPLVNLALDASGTLAFVNAAVEAGVAKAPASYSAAWSILDNTNGTTRPVEATTSATTRMSAPAGLPSTAGSFVVAEVRATNAEHASWAKPVRATFRREASGWKLVGLERTVDGAAAPSAGAPEVAAPRSGTASTK